MDSFVRNDTYFSFFFFFQVFWKLFCGSFKFLVEIDNSSDVPVDHYSKFLRDVTG